MIMRIRSSPFGKPRSKALPELPKTQLPKPKERGVVFTVPGEDIMGPRKPVLTLYLRDGKIVSSDPESNRSKNILKGEVREPLTGKTFTAQQDPEKFLKLLCFKYGSVYISASKLKEL